MKKICLLFLGLVGLSGAAYAVPGGPPGGAPILNSNVYQKGAVMNIDTATVRAVILTTATINGATFYFNLKNGAAGQSIVTDGASPIQTLKFQTISGGGGGSSSLGIYQSNVQVSSPTGAVNFVGPPFAVTLQGSTSAQVTLNSSSVTLRGPNVVYMQDSLQTGASFYTQNGTVNDFHASTITVGDQANFVSMSSVTFNSFSTMTFENGTALDMSTGILILPNGGGLVTNDCNANSQRGRIFVSTNATSGRQLYVCEGSSGWILSSGGSGTSPLGVYQSGVIVSSPTGALNFLGPPFKVALQGSSTSQITLDNSSVTLQGQNVIFLQDTLQKNASFYTQKGTSVDFHASTLTVTSEADFVTVSTFSFVAFSTMVFQNGTALDLSTAIFTLPNGAVLVSTDCQFDSQRGRIYIATGATSGQQVYVCEGSSGWIAEGQTFGAYIKNSNTLNFGTTFYTSSGTVSGQFSVTSIKWPDGTIQVSSPSAGGGGGGAATLPLPAGATNYIQNSDTLQSGATFYVSSGTVSGTLQFGTQGADLKANSTHLKTDATFEAASAIITNAVTAAGANNAFGTATAITGNPTVSIIPTSDTRVGAIVQAKDASQTADLQEWQDSSGNVLSSVTAAGLFSVAGLIVNSTFTAPAQSTTVIQGVMLDGTGSAGTTNYVWTSQGGGLNPHWKAQLAGSGGGGAATLPLPGGATNYVQNTGTLQSGSTFYVSSGTVAGQLSDIDPAGIQSIVDSFNETTVPPGVIRAVKTNFSGGLGATGGTYRVAVTTRSVLPSSGVSGQTELLMIPPVANSDGQLELFVNGVEDWLMDSSHMEMAVPMDIRVGNPLKLHDTGSVEYIAVQASGTLAGDSTYVLPETVGSVGDSLQIAAKYSDHTDTKWGSSGGGAATLPLPAGATNYIQNSGTLQSGSTFYTSSGTVAGQLSVTSIKWPDGTIQVSSPAAGGSSGSSDTSVRVYQSTGPIIPKSSSFTFTFDTENYDTSAMHDTSVNASRLIAPTAGKYRIFASVIISTPNESGISPPAGESVQLFLRVNGSTIIAEGVVQSPTSGLAVPGVVSVSAYTEWNLGVNDYVEAFVKNLDPANSATVIAYPSYSPTFGMTLNGGGGSSSGGSSTSINPSTQTITFASGFYPIHEELISAAGGLCQISNGCSGPNQYETSTSSQEFVADNFSGGTTQYWQTNFPLPTNYVSASTFTVKVVWSATTTVTASWNVAMVAVSTGSSIDSAWGTAVVISTGATGSQQWNQSQESTAITAAGSPTPNKNLWVRVSRGDSGGDARMLGIRIYWPYTNVSAN